MQRIPIKGTKAMQIISVPARRHPGAAGKGPPDGSRAA